MLWSPTEQGVERRWKSRFVASAMAMAAMAQAVLAVVRAEERVVMVTEPRPAQLKPEVATKLKNSLQSGVPRDRE